MEVRDSVFTIADYCRMLQDKSLSVNRDYQRSNKVWPAAARSYLIDTILKGYPLPKFLLRQRTDLAARRTWMEIVDGQQRSQAILDFFEDRFRLSASARLGAENNRGQRLSDLEDDVQERFLGYGLSCDIFVNSTDGDIREVFRRINSYTVPLNAQELRHATRQGPFKWFIVTMSSRYADALKSLGVLNEGQLNRMADGELLTDIIYSIYYGIETPAKGKLDDLFADNDDDFPREQEVESRLDAAFAAILAIDSLFGSRLMSRYNFFSLFLAITHAQRTVPVFSDLYDFGDSRPLSDPVALRANLSVLENALEAPEDADRDDLRKFVEDSSKGTNVKARRERRFEMFCRALLPEPLLD